MSAIQNPEHGTWCFIVVSVVLGIAMVAERFSYCDRLDEIRFGNQ